MGDVKGSRRQKADATRQRILQAAQAEFEEKGYHGATVASIAKRAGVAGQTVYFVFHTKSALISALIDSLVMGEEPVIPQESEWWQEMVAEPDPARALGHFLRGAGPLFERASTISEILRGAALTDDEVRRTHDFHEGLRATGFREVIEVIAGKGRLRLPAEKATDVLLTAYGDSSYYLMTTERGWTHDEYVEWACQALPELLLEPGGRLDG
jgi:AcrR family transcriptional regulator